MRYYNQQVTIEKLLVKLSESDQVDQYYFVDIKGEVLLIYPFQGDEERRENIEKYIANHH